MSSTDSSRHASPVAKKPAFGKKCKICCNKVKRSFKRCFSKVGKGGAPLWIGLGILAYILACIIIPDSLVYPTKEGAAPEAQAKPTEPVVEESKKEEANPEELKQEEANSEDTKKEEEKAAEAKPEEVKVEEPKAEEPKTEEPKAEEPEVVIQPESEII